MRYMKKLSLALIEECEEAVIGCEEKCFEKCGCYDCTCYEVCMEKCEYYEVPEECWEHDLV